MIPAINKEYTATNARVCSRLMVWVDNAARVVVIAALDDWSTIVMRIPTNTRNKRINSVGSAQRERSISSATPLMASCKSWIPKNNKPKPARVSPINPTLSFPNNFSKAPIPISGKAKLEIENYKQSSAIANHTI